MILLVFGLLTIIGGFNSSIVKYTVNIFPPLILVALRALIAFLAVTPFLLKSPKITFDKNFYQMFLINILFAANWLTFAVGIQKTNVNISQLLYVPTSLIVAIFSVILLKEKFSKVQIAGLVMTILGAGILAFESQLEANGAFGDPVGNLIVAIGVFCWSMYLVLSKKISKIYSPLEIISCNFFVSFVITFILAIAMSKSQPFDLSNTPPSGYLGILYVGIVASAIYFYFNQWLVKRTSAFFASMQVYPITILAALSGSIFFSEPLTVSLLFSSFLIMSGVFLSTSYQYIKKRKDGKN